MPKKVSKKVVKAPKVEKPKPVKTPKGDGVINMKAEVRLQEYEISAVIPTQEYGNITPRILVTAPSMEEARKVVMPHIEELYKQYVVSPLGVRSPSLSGRSTVTAEEKKVEVDPKGAEEATGSSAEVSVPSSSNSNDEDEEGFPNNIPEKPKSEAYQNGAKAIASASSHPALNVIEEKIRNSVKISAEDKPELQKLIDVRRNEIPF